MKILHTKLFRLIISLLIISVEFFLLYLFKDGAVRFSTEDSIRTYLNEHSTNQFWLATHMRIIFMNALYSFLIIFFIMSKKYFKKYFFQCEIISSTIAINIISFIFLLGIFILINDPRPLIADPSSFASIIYTVSPLVWLIYFWSIVNFTLPLKTLIKWIVENSLLSLFILIATILSVNQELINGVVNFLSFLLLQPTLDIDWALISRCSPEGCMGQFLEQINSKWKFGLNVQAMKGWD